MRLVSASPTPLEPAPDAMGEGVSTPGASSDAPAVERALALRAQAGDLEAFAELVARRTPGVVAFLRRMLGDAEDARDVAQITFLRVWENIGRGRSRRGCSGSPAISRSTRCARARRGSARRPKASAS